MLGTELYILGLNHTLRYELLCNISFSLPFSLFPPPPPPVPKLRAITWSYQKLCTNMVISKAVFEFLVLMFPFPKFKWGKKMAVAV